MKKILSLTIGLAVITGINVKAQDLPQPSPAAKVEQRVGLTDISVSYSSPGVKGRVIWGGLVPYGEVWRTGANKATAVTFSDDVKVNGKNLNAGTYALFTIPGEKEWTIILSSNTEQWGSGSYKQEEDALRFNVKPGQASQRERLTFTFENTTENTTLLTLRWEKLSVAFPIVTEVDAKAQNNIKEALASAKADDWQVYRNSARYYLQSGNSLDQALEWVDKALTIKNDNWYTHALKGDIQAAMGKHKDAIASNQKAIELGEAEAKADGSEFSYKKDLEEEINKWKANQ
ncbi:MAG: DUF2911 domain-containing protein [Flavobacteriales bacterium]|nr:DUF2911 domain-containing protein [Flavobacteriales bacterium]